MVNVIPFVVVFLFVSVFTPAAPAAAADWTTTSRLDHHQQTGPPAAAADNSSSSRQQHQQQTTAPAAAARNIYKTNI